MLKALKIRPWKPEELVGCMPTEDPPLTAEQSMRAMASALTRLRVKNFVAFVGNMWRLQST